MTQPTDRPWNQPQQAPAAPAALAQQARAWTTPQKITACVGALIVAVLFIADWQVMIALAIFAAVFTAIIMAVRAQAEDRRRQAEIYAARAREIASYHAMNSREFEHSIAYLCQRDGCTNVQVVGGRGDLGADVKATAPDGRLIVIQCKRYSHTNKVGSGDMQKFGGTCYSVHGAQVAALVTTSTFTRQAAD